ncbi:MAG: hypothetical protein GQE15_18685 [Archangiaceae bacterium]|nr:hypothetical protein [Archangiaceae bacterium]
MASALEAFETHLQRGIEAACEEFRARRVLISGFALCTDDDFLTLFHVASDHGARLFADYAEFIRTKNLDLVHRLDWAMPIEWKLDATGIAAVEFAKASNLLRQIRDPLMSLAAHRLSVSRSVCSVLSSARPLLEAISEPSLELLLLFVSTGDLDESRDREMVLQLNSPPLAAHWQKAVFAI